MSERDVLLTLLEIINKRMLKGGMDEIRPDYRIGQDELVFNDIVYEITLVFLGALRMDDTETCLNDISDKMMDDAFIAKKGTMLWQDVVFNASQKIMAELEMYSIKEKKIGLN